MTLAKLLYKENLMIYILPPHPWLFPHNIVYIFFYSAKGEKYLFKVEYFLFACLFFQLTAFVLKTCPVISYWTDGFVFVGL